MKPALPIDSDEHLRAALRHAPDADAAAPDHISAQIIAAAHRSAGERATPLKRAPTRAPEARGRWWLQPWGASGALATVLMAGVIGLMWRGEAPGPAREEAGPQVAQAPVIAHVTAPSSAPVPAPVSAPVPTPVSTPEPALATPAAATKSRVLAAAPAVKPPTKAAVQPMAPEPSETLASARDVATVVPVPPLPPVQAAQAAEAAEAALAAPPAAAAHLRAIQRAAQEQSAAAPPTAAAPAAVARLRAQASASMALPPPWRTTPQTGDAFNWQPADRLQPPDAAWLARLAALSAGRWQPLSAAPASTDIALLQWQRSGATVARIGFDRSSVWWCSSEGRCERTPLDAATVLNLLDQLAR